MKKINSLIATAALALAMPLASHADLSFTVNGSKVTSGQTVAFASPTITPLGPMKMVKYQPKIELTSSYKASNIVVNVKSLTGQPVQCCAGGQCEQAVSVTKKGVIAEANTPLDILFEYSGTLAQDAEIPTISAKIEAQYYMDDESLISFVITMSETSGINLIEVKPASVTPTAEGLVYNLAGEGTITIASITGTTVMQAKVSGTGILDIDLPSGMYVYNLRNNEISVNGKFVRQ